MEILQNIAEFFMYLSIVTILFLGAIIYTNHKESKEILRPTLIAVICLCYLLTYFL